MEPFPLLITIHMPEKFLATIKTSLGGQKHKSHGFYDNHRRQDKQKQKQYSEKKVQSTPANPSFCKCIGNAVAEQLMVR